VTTRSMVEFKVYKAHGDHRSMSIVAESVTAVVDGVMSDTSVIFTGREAFVVVGERLGVLDRLGFNHGGG
jgi:hypothetical protein